MIWTAWYSRSRLIWCTIQEKGNGYQRVGARLDWFLRQELIEILSEVLAPQLMKIKPNCEPWAGGNEAGVKFFTVCDLDEEQLGMELEMVTGKIESHSITDTPKWRRPMCQFLHLNVISFAKGYESFCSHIGERSIRRPSSCPHSIPHFPFRLLAWKYMPPGTHVRLPVKTRPQTRE